jgi:hypothetical protein
MTENLEYPKLAARIALQKKIQVNALAIMEELYDHTDSNGKSSCNIRCIDIRVNLDQN